MDFLSIQIHATLQCNLACKHCYSSSHPKYKDAVEPSALKKFLSFAHSYGFNNISFSGGEPFIYRDFAEIIAHTKMLGFQNTVASNGMLLKSNKNQAILDEIDLIAISIDGNKNLHDEIRAQDGAYAKMMEGVEVLKRKNLNFGFIHSLTHKSWHQLIELADFAFDKGAKLFQIHPIENAGRATEEAMDLILTDDDKHKAFILCAYLQSKYENKMIIQFDMIHKELISEFPSLIPNYFGHQGSINSLTDVLETIVITEQGDILPIAYGMHYFFKIGNIYDFEENIFDKYVDEKLECLADLNTHTYQQILQKDSDIVNWNEELIDQSHQMCLV